jgi:hypothetical protein
MPTPSISDPFVDLAVESLEPNPKGSNAEEIRETHLHHEISIQAVRNLSVVRGISVHRQTKGTKQAHV